MIAETILSRLDGVRRRTGADRWLAHCPAHDDKLPSLSVREIDGDRVLVHCCAGCSIEDVIGAVGLTFDALYSERTTERRRKVLYVDGQMPVSALLDRRRGSDHG